MKNINKVFSPSRQKTPVSLILELDYNRNLEDFSKTVDEFKELKINQKEEAVKNEEDDISILYYEDTELKEMLNDKVFPEKEFNIVNKFLRVEEEDNLLLNDISKNHSNMTNFGYGTDDDGIVLSQLSQKLLEDDEFQPGLFTSFDFKDKIKSLIYNTLTSKNMDFDYNIKKINNNDKTVSSYYSKESDFKYEDEDKDGMILNLCLKDNNIESDNVIINFNKEIKEKDRKGSSIDEEKTYFEGFQKSEAIPEYENQIISYQNYNQIQQNDAFSSHPVIMEDAFDVKLFDYLANVSKIIQDRGLKNKIKLIIKLILYKDPETKKHIFNNREKNELLLYWKNRYIKELEEATFKEKNKIIKQKLNSLDPNNKLLEFSRKKKVDLKKSQTRNSAMYHNLIRNVRFNSQIKEGIKKLDIKSSKNMNFKRYSDDK